jgi:CheY-like chemotaxis protein
VDLDDVIDAAVEAVLPAATAKDIDIRVERATAGLTMMGDATRLQQAVWNLLSNAVKFTPSGGRVDVHTSIEDGEIELSITDSGIGIEPAFLPYVFDRFRQADASTTRAYGGLGLGLAIVRHLVELHGGRVRAESDGTNTGTRFIINLPRKELLLSTTERRPVPTETARDVGIRLDNLRVLLVDDDHTSCDVMSEALRGYGASVHAAMSVAEAVDCLAAFQPDLVLSDVAMPVQDGFALLRELRSREILLGRRVPIAAVTARARPEDREQALAAGFDEYLTKPVEPAALAGAVSALATMANQ